MSAISTCRTCVYWEMEKVPHDIGAPVPGMCHRNPPVALVLPMPDPLGLQIRTTFPTPTSAFWCGEHKSRLD